MLPILFVIVASTGQSPMPSQWAKFSRSGALSRVTETVDIATGDMKGSQIQYRLRYIRHAPRSVDTIEWADSETCPAIRSVMLSMRDIAVPAPAPYGLSDGSITITADGTEYSLTAPSSDNMGKITISSNVGSSLAQWIEASFQQLKPCWKAAS